MDLVSHTRALAPAWKRGTREVGCSDWIPDTGSLVGQEGAAQLSQETEHVARVEDAGNSRDAESKENKGFRLGCLWLFHCQWLFVFQVFL